MRESDFKSGGESMKHLALIALLMGLCSMAWASEIPSTLVERAILGEALPNYEAMHDIASAIRNRGTLKGVYGVRSRNYDKASPKLRALASKAWASSASLDTVGGADHWLSEYDLKHCKPRLTAFRFGMVETMYRHKTHFYRAKK